MYDSCMPMIPGDTCLEQTVCCVVLQGNSDAHPVSTYLLDFRFRERGRESEKADEE